MNSENKNSFGYRNIKLKKYKKSFVKSFLQQLKNVINSNNEAYKK